MPPVVMLFASCEEVDLEMCCRRRRTLKLLNMLFLSFPLLRYTLKEIARYYSCGYECFQWTALSLNNFESTPWFYHEFMSTPKAFFQQVFALHKLYCTFFYTSYKYLHITRCLFFSIIFSPTSLSDSKLLQKDLLSLFM